MQYVNPKLLYYTFPKNFALTVPNGLTISVAIVQLLGQHWSTSKPSGNWQWYVILPVDWVWLTVDRLDELHVANRRGTAVLYKYIIPAEAQTHT